ncbi:MAG: Na+/H+ antiporter [Gemmatimonadaceae bacterium]|nr:Na+/H+ antiporter [Gloeobacterales cyanobacterium ES-bin-141]
MHVVEIVLGLLVAICVLVVLARKLSVPYPIVLVLGGLALSLVPELPQVELDPELVFVLFLPPLLCAAAWSTSWRDFRANVRPISLLALGLVFATTFAVAVAVHALVPSIPWAAAFALGAIVSPPDAVAATAVTESLGVPRRITTILGGESLVNDASGLVAYRFAVAAAVTGMFSPIEAVGRFVLLVVGGVAVGFAVGFTVAWLQKQIEDAPIEIALTLFGAYGAYLLAEQWELSGVLAVVTTGLYHRYRSSEIMSPASRNQVMPVWRMLEFVFNGLAFILIGLQLPYILDNLGGRSLSTLLGYAALVSVVVIGVRLLWVFPATYLPRLLVPGLAERDPIPPWQPVFLLGWTGMRGVVSLAAALALPTVTATGQPFPERDLILFLSFAVILVTLVLQGLSLPPLIRFLGLADDGSGEREERLGRRQAAEAALVRIEKIALERPEHEDSPVLRRMREQYLARLRLFESEEEAIEELYEQMRSEVELQHEVLAAERALVVRLRNEGAISDEALMKIERELDFEVLRLRA